MPQLALLVNEQRVIFESIGSHRLSWWIDWGSEHGPIRLCAGAAQVPCLGFFIWRATYCAAGSFSGHIRASIKAVRIPIDTDAKR